MQDVQKLGLENAISLCGGVEYLGNIHVKDNQTTTIMVEFQPNNLLELLATNTKRTFVFQHSKISYILQIVTTKSGKYSVQKEEISYYSNIKLFGGIEFKSKNEIFKAFDLPNNPEFISSVIRQHGKIHLKNNNHLGKSVAIQVPNDPEARINRNDLVPRYLQPLEGTQRWKDFSTKTLLERVPYLLPSDAFNFSIYDFDLKKAKETTPITGKADLEENGENLAIVIRNILSDKEKKRRFGNLLSDILPFVKKLETEKFYETSLLLTINEIYNSNARLPSFLLSDGTISITAILTALFFQEKGLAIFEEPEHGIHPALVAKLVQYFYDASKNKQIIITTHSPEVVKYTHLDDLILISRGDNGFATMSRPKEKEMVQAFLQNELGLDRLFAQNLLDM